MASESSSAVLELNDADAEDTEATTVTDDAHEGVPLIMEHGYDIAVKVDAPMKQLSTLETYVTYRVRCVCARWPTPPYVRRRYNHFKVLHRRLSTSHPLLAPPPLPPLHSARQQLDRYSPSFVALRTCALNAFLERVAKHPILTHSEDFRIFLTTPDDELEKVFKSENSALNLWGFSSALYGSGETKTTNGPRVKDPEFTSAADYLQSLQQKLSTLCSLTTKLHKSSLALSTEYTAMKRACDAWTSQSSGLTARGTAGCAAGAARAGGAGGGPGGRPPLQSRALLPLLAAYAAAHVQKISQRDQIHAAYVAGTNTTDDLHNRLEQASEALRSELSDWIPKTRSEIKALLLDLTDRQVNQYTQAVHGWEQGLKLASETNIGDIFKTVSKTAVQNLSPSRCLSEMTPTETERDLDDYSEEFDPTSHEDFDNHVLDDASEKIVADNQIDGESNLESTVKSSDDVLNEILEDSKATDVRPLESKNASTTDPLRDFTDVDLS
ncbi:sorting nexin-7-like [Spodoptera litura]|uniref:Sorting nexin-7-like n=1 Tax=Spodoptera litura TaxID=69820 RepID=A0A9J7DZQ3_SPOLT|nr:sorting nexin-7-like [Spodoptera litura]